MTQNLHSDVILYQRISSTILQTTDLLDCNDKPTSEVFAVISYMWYS